MWEQIKRRSSYQALPTIEPKKPLDLFRDLHHPIFQNIKIVHVSAFQIDILFVFILTIRTSSICQQNDPSRDNSNVMQTHTIITLSKLVTPQALHQCLKFIYSGTIDTECTNLKVNSISNHQTRLNRLDLIVSARLPCLVSFTFFGRSRNRLQYVLRSFPFLS